MDVSKSKREDIFMWTMSTVVLSSPPLLSFRCRRTRGSHPNWRSNLIKQGKDSSFVRVTNSVMKVLMAQNSFGSRFASSSNHFPTNPKLQTTKLPNNQPAAFSLQCNKKASNTGSFFILGG